MSDNILCAHCLNNKRHLVDCTTALFNYRYPVNLLVHNIKYHDDLVAAGILGQLLANHLKTEGVELPECILPVPLHPLRLAMRGYNQALEIARPLSTSLGLPIETTLCKRARYTGPQARLSPIERKRNVHNAFALNRNNKYRHIAIIDDVMTTGSTMRELAKLFRGTGTVYIQAWVCARAVTR